MRFPEDVKRGLGSERVQVGGPAAAPMARRAGRRRAQLQLQSSSRAALQELLAAVVPTLDELPSKRQLRWSVDVDPADLF